MSVMSDNTLYLNILTFISDYPESIFRWISRSFQILMLSTSLCSVAYVQQMPPSASKQKQVSAAREGQPLLSMPKCFSRVSDSGVCVRCVSFFVPIIVFFQFAVTCWCLVHCRLLAHAPVSE